jgi:hypothetical protein
MHYRKLSAYCVLSSIVLVEIPGLVGEIARSIALEMMEEFNVFPARTEKFREAAHTLEIGLAFVLP